MKTRTTHSILLATALASVVTCAAPPGAAQLPAVGPFPGSGDRSKSEGSLQVFSAKAPATRDLQAEIYFWNNDFGKNEFVRGASHTAYSIYSSDGRLLQKVPNSTGGITERPTAVQLPPGRYQIEAALEEAVGATRVVRVPVCIESGASTVVHLDGDWTPSKKTRDAAVRLQNGTYVGFRANCAE